ncbi:MAG: response regulator, partial [Betaproteobacteria bacterium]
GPGIPLEFRTKIFGKFSQADSSDTRQKSGTGLGLSIVKTMTEKHNGTVTFDSQIGSGTTFHVMLPLVEPETLAATVEPTAVPPGPTRASLDKHVLICEDDSALAASIERTLHCAGYTADIAYDLAQARAHLAKTHYGAMTLDLKLPDGDGKQLLAELRAVPATKHLPVIVLSGYADDRTIGLDGSEAPPLSWLSKPVDSQRLLNLLHRTIAQPGARPRILHVEDDRDVKQVIAAIVGELADFDHASTLEQARRKINDGVYSLVLLDLELPDGSGWDLLADLNRLVPPPPVVLFSASELTADEAKRVAASLTKSHTTNEALLNVIGRLLRRPPAARAPSSTVDKQDTAS